MAALEPYRTETTPLPLPQPNQVDMSVKMKLAWLQSMITNIDRPFQPYFETVEDLARTLYGRDEILLLNLPEPKKRYMMSKFNEFESG